jgi:hypothetical protein
MSGISTHKKSCPLLFWWQSFNISTKYSVLIIEFSLKSPCLHPVFGPPFIPKPLFWVRSAK